MIKSIICMLILLSSAALTDVQNKQPAEPRPNQWEKDIRSFEEWDSKNTFASNAVLFVGSSSIRLWATCECFPEFAVINRGFGGSQISDVNYFAHRIVLPYKPKVIVFYAGDNDIAEGKSPKRVFDDFRKFVKFIHKHLPETRIIFISIKPSPSRWSFWPIAKKANLMVKELSDKEERVTFADVGKVLLDRDGKPNTKLYVDDKLHLNSKGYEAWTKLLRPMIERELKSD